jgi:hypothetical protein
LLWSQLNKIASHLWNVWKYLSKNGLPYMYVFFNNIFFIKNYHLYPGWIRSHDPRAKIYKIPQDQPTRGCFEAMGKVHAMLKTAYSA